MKIGVVTVHDSANFGSFLQAFAMKEALSELGHEVFFIKTRDEKFVKKLYYKYPISKKSIKHPISVIKAYFEGREKKKLFFEDISLLNELDCYDDTKLDKVILGSDEIWNINIPSFTNEIFYGANMKEVSAFAVSAGSATIEQYSSKENLVNHIRSLKKIYVRDENTKNLVSHFCGKMPEVVCDPTFLVPVEKYMKENSRIGFIAEKYILVYVYQACMNETLKAHIIRFAKDNHLKIISTCFKYDWCDYINCSPLDFCDILRKAKFVVTTTFHGSIFSVLNHKRFVCIPYGIKTNDVLNRLQLHSVILSNVNSYDEFRNILLNNEIDYDSVDQIVLDMRNQSIKKLEYCIGD